MSKKKGTKAERELFHMFWDTGNWAVVRAAGSGSTPLPAPDLIVGNGKKVYAIECKSLKKDNSKYFKENEIELLGEFSKIFGAEPLVAARFNNKGWFFIKTKDLGVSKKKTYFVNLKIAQEKGLNFENIIKL